jgi:Met-zincin/Domain of unknown function (DUF5117)
MLACLLALIAAAAPPSLPTVAERVAGLTRHEGFVPFYWDARQGQLLLEPTHLDQDFLYGAGLAGGAGTVAAALDRGQLGGLALVRFERVGPRVLLRQIQTRHRATSDDAEQRRSVEESFPSSVLAALPLVAESDGRVLVDATDFLLRDKNVASGLREAEQGDWRQDLARSVFVGARSEAFPRNTELEALLTFTCDNPPAGLAAVLAEEHTLSVRQHHTFLALPPAGFVARVADPRVGSIGSTHKDFTAPRTEPLERRLAARWRLAKAHPEQAVSEPVEPIVFYLDRGIPEPERSTIRDAALWWNHAFLLAGFKDALVIKDLPEGATFLDARYSGIEWIHRTERAWSIGEILHAVARLDSHRRRTTARQWTNLAEPRGACEAGASPDFAFMAGLDVDGAVDEQALVLQRLAYLSAHEVGHTLGFDHNWAASTFGWGSVMDYLTANVQLKRGGLDLADAFPKDIGSYDRLLVQWGYTPDLDPAALDALVRDAYAQGVVFPHDSDPRWAEYDWGPDPIAWLRTTLDVRRVILERFGPAQLRPGRPISDLVGRFNLAYLYHRFGIQAAQGYVGGQFQTNALAGDGQTPLLWVPAARQKQALELLLQTLEPAQLDVPDRIQAALVAAPAGTESGRERFNSEAGATFSVLSAARSLSSLVIVPLLQPDRAARLTLAEGPDALTLTRMLRRLVAATWAVPADTSARAAALRRVVQRVTLDALFNLAANVSAAPEVHGQVLAQLERLRADLRLRQATDAAAEAHLRSAERDLVEFIERPDVRRPRDVAPPAPPGRPIG